MTRITARAFSSHPHVRQAWALPVSLWSFFTLSHPESEPDMMMLVSQKKKLRFRESKSLPASPAVGQQRSQEAGPGL